MPEAIHAVFLRLQLTREVPYGTPTKETTQAAIEEIANLFEKSEWRLIGTEEEECDNLNEEY